MEIGLQTKASEKVKSLWHFLYVTAKVRHYKKGENGQNNKIKKE